MKLLGQKVFQETLLALLWDAHAHAPAQMPAVSAAVSTATSVGSSKEQWEQMVAERT